MIFVNIILFFGVPLLVLVIFPIQKATTLWQTPTVWDSTFYIALSLVGGLLKAFIRPTKDEENPYSDKKTSWPVIVSYFLWLLFFVIWIFLFSAAADQQVP